VWGSRESAAFLIGTGPWSRGAVRGARVLTVEKPSHLGELFVLRARALWAQGKVTEAEVRWVPVCLVFTLHPNIVITLHALPYDRLL